MTHSCVPAGGFSLSRETTASVTKPGEVVVSDSASVTGERRPRVRLHTGHWSPCTLSLTNVEFAMGQRAWTGTKPTPGYVPCLECGSKVKLNQTTYASLSAAGHILVGQ